MSTQDSRWVALSALGAAMFALGFSVTGVACSTRDMSVAEAARAASSTNAVPAPAASLGAIATAVNGSPNVAPGAPITSAGTSDTRSAGDLKLKRLVVTHKIENREPAADAEFKLGAAPVYAFVELENSAASARSIRVLFMNEDTKATVGHVKLSVPGAQPHYRTWGNTRMIREAGHWVAVVTTVDGVELGRAPFQVTS